MALRRRLSIISAAIVGIAIVIACVVCYAVVRSQLLGSIDNALRNQRSLIEATGDVQTSGGLPSRSASAGGPAPYVQLVYTNGATRIYEGHLSWKVDSHCVKIAQSANGSELDDVWTGNNHLRVLTFASRLINGQPVALQLARPLNPTDTVLRDLRIVLLFVLLGGVIVAGLLGRLASRRVLRPLNEIAATAEVIGETDDLALRLRVHADDEVGSLARRFNAMLDRLQGSRAALDESMRQQRQLVADASHELRTPVTSLRTNIEVLLQGAVLDEEDRQRLLADVVEQSEELSALVNDLIELARGDQPGAEPDDVRVDRVVVACVERARRNAPGITFEAEIEPAQIDGVAERVERAVNNLLDNAARHSPEGGIVEIHAGVDGVIVRDHGSGVDEEDLPYVFDRFYRGTNSRGRQGSGLGLAIVRQVTEQLGGTASVANAPDGGAVFTLALPGEPPDAHDEDDDGAITADGTGDPLQIG
jgi:two-component system sensor histidine kinase MprB